MPLRSPKKNLQKMIPFFDNTFPPEVITFVSCRPSDFSLTATQNDTTKEQKQFLSEQLGFTFTGAVNIRQVHGNKVIFVSKGGTYVSPEVLEEADGILTDAVNLPIVIRTADCVPIFLYDQDQRRIGLLHAGWKGTQRQILLEGLKLIGAHPENVKIAFGPAIRECCYKIGAGVLNYFPKNAIQKKGEYYLDLVKVNRVQAIDYGIREENITDCKVCTCCDESYFSHRREGEGAGRNVSLMMLKK